MMPSKKLSSNVISRRNAITTLLGISGCLIADTALSQDIALFPQSTAFDNVTNKSRYSDSYKDKHPVYIHGQNVLKKIALTFDDGPHPTLTPILLDILNARGAKATFFVIGQRVAASPHILHNMAKNGHQIANHTWSHPDLSRMSKKHVFKQVQRANQIITQTTGLSPRMMRPPYGSYTPSQSKWLINDQDIATVLWSIDTLDWKRPGSSVVSQRIVNQAFSGSIILTHDIHPQTIRAIPAALDALIAAGYEFTTVADILGMAPYHNNVPTLSNG